MNYEEMVPATFEPLVLDDSDWSETAWMSRTDVGIVQRVLACKAVEANSAGRQLSVLEWGSGRSTKGLPEFLSAERHTYRWLSLEHDRSYFHSEVWPTLEGSGLDAGYRSIEDWPIERGRSMVDKSDTTVEVVVFDYGPLNPQLPEHAVDRTVDMNDYITFPARLGRHYDVVLIDGRSRRRCLVEAASLGAERTVSVLHDAHRAYYHCAFAGFRTQRRVGQSLWIGTQYDHDVGATDYLSQLIQEGEAR